MKNSIILLSLLIGAIVCMGLKCATVSAGSDPFVVRVEQGLTVAPATFDLILNEDQANRSFWITNAPPFHRFAEWLRTPTPYNGTNVARCVAMQLQVDDLKLAYQSSKTAANSNALYGVFGLLEAAIGQAGAWSAIVTNKPGL